MNINNIITRKAMEKGAVFMVIYGDHQRDVVHMTGRPDFPYRVGTVNLQDVMDAKQHVLQLAELRDGIATVLELQIP